MNQSKSKSFINIAILCCLAPFLPKSSSMSTAPSKLTSTTTTTPPPPPSSLSFLNGPTLRKVVTDAARTDNDSTLDLHGILWTEHLNLVVGSKPLAEYFYNDVLGCTPDGGKSFHVNLGQQQFHLAAVDDDGEQPAQIVAGRIGLALPSLSTLRERIEIETTRRKKLRGTLFGVTSDFDGCLTLRCPWGNTIDCFDVRDDDKKGSSSLADEPLDTPRKMENAHAEGGDYGGHRMAVRGKPGIRYVVVACPLGKVSAVARFYREIVGCTVQEMKGDGGVDTAVVCVGPGVHLVFVEGDVGEEERRGMEGVHVCFYADDFEGLYGRLAERGLVWTNPRFTYLDTCDTWEEAKASRTLRFRYVVDLLTNETILELEHETRPLRHGQYLKTPRYDPI